MSDPLLTFIGFLAFFLFLDWFLPRDPKVRRRSVFTASDQAFFVAYKKSRMLRWPNVIALSLILTYAYTLEPIPDDRWIYPVLIIVLVYYTALMLACFWWAEMQARRAENARPTAD